MGTSSQYQLAIEEKIWRTLDSITEKHERIAARIDRMSAETDRMKVEADRMKVETDRRIQENDRLLEEMAQRLQETDRQLQETDRQLKKTDARFNSQWGKLMESLVEGDLVPLLNKQGVPVEQTSTNIKGGQEGRHYEFDILAVNGRQVVVVEVKTTLRSEDVTHFLSKLERFSDWVRRFKGSEILGAVAYLKADASVVRQAERRGLYVIRATGSSASIVNGKGFRPKVYE